MANRESRRRNFRLARLTTARRAPFARRLVVLLAVLAMALQSLVVQTHVHRTDAPGAAALASIDQSAAAAPSGKTAPDKFPIHEDPANCPLCQEFHHTGSFVAPTTAVLALPLSIHLSLIVFADPVLALRVLSHDWQGRAPPRA